MVTGANGPEAGVWVIAETADLPTKFAKIVVTDDQGRYLVPDLPKANYTVWVRCYGLVDSAKIQTEPGKIVDLKATPAPGPAAAAQYYPARLPAWAPGFGIDRTAARAGGNRHSVPRPERTHLSSGLNRPNPGRVHVSYRTFSHAWAFHPKLG